MSPEIFLDKITLLGTTHKEAGKCTVNSLYSIIEKINPDLIFEETDLMSYYTVYILKQKSDSMERTTIQKYVNNHNIKNIPIDTLEYPKDFTEWNNKILQDLQYPDETNKELLELTNFIKNYYADNGFGCINTEYFDNLIIKKYQIWENYIHNYRKHLVKYYDDFINFVYEEREFEMINNISKYQRVQNNNFNAVLLLGADHRMSITKKLQKITGIEYDFYYNS